MRRALCAAGLVIAMLAAAMPAQAITVEALQQLPGEYRGTFDLSTFTSLPGAVVVQNSVGLDVVVAIDAEQDPASFVIVANGVGQFLAEGGEGGVFVCVDVHYTIGPLEATGVSSAGGGLIELFGSATVDAIAWLGGCADRGSQLADVTNVVPVSFVGLDQFGLTGQIAGVSSEAIDVQAVNFGMTLFAEGEAAITGAAPEPEATAEPTADPAAAADDQPAATDDGEATADPGDDTEEAGELEIEDFLPPELGALCRGIRPVDACRVSGYDAGAWPGFDAATIADRVLVAAATRVVDPESTASAFSAPAAYPVLLAAAPVLAQLVKERNNGNGRAGRAADRFAQLLLDMELNRVYGGPPPS